jgi:hypothetical protein
MNLRRGALLAAPALLLVAACNGPGADQAAEVAQRFERLATSDPAAACSLLAPGTLAEVEKAAEKSCAEAFPDEDLPDPSDLASVDVFGHDAIARFGNDTVFLARFPDGWRITAAACRPGPDDQKPYDCDIKGG